MKSTKSKLPPPDPEVAAEKLGEALAEVFLAKEAQEPNDREHRKYLLHDLNGLLAAAGPGAEVVDPSLLSDPPRFRRHLQASLLIPAQVLARELPNRLARWLAQEPEPGREWHQWAVDGLWLVEQSQ